MKEAVIIFVRVPEKGKVKTRLARTEGEDFALAVYKKLLEHTREVALEVEAERYLFYTPFPVKEDAWEEQYFNKQMQVDGDLGTRMKTAFHQAFQDGKEKVIIIGSDCPSLSVHHLHDAFQQLEYHDLVIGPSTDGGYYLLGMNRMHAFLFENKKWSTDTVLQDTIDEVLNAGLTLHTLPALTDVDEIADLPMGWMKT